MVLDTPAVHMSILEDGGSTQHRLGVAEIRLAARSPGPPQHRHARHDEGFYVVSGTVTFTIADQTLDARAGSFVMVPPGAPHTFENRADAPTRPDVGGRDRFVRGRRRDHEPMPVSVRRRRRAGG